MRISKKTGLSLLLFCVAVVCITAFEQESSRDLQHIQKQKTLRIAINPNEVDCYLSDSGFACFHYELAQIFADSMHLNLSATAENDLERTVRKLQNGRYDIIVGTIPVTTELQKKVAFSKPVLFNKQVLVQRKSEKIDNIAQLAGDTVFVGKHSPSVLRVKNLSEEIGEKIFIVETPEPESKMIRKVANGEIRYFVCDFRTAKQFADENVLDFSQEIGFIQIEAWAFRTQSPELKQAVDSFMRRFQNTETYQELYQKYYN